MGFLDSVSRAFGSLRPLSDAELESQYEVLRQQHVPHTDLAKVTRRENEMRRYNDEITRRYNEKYLRENPDAPTRHRQHGWYLPNDD